MQVALGGLRGDIFNYSMSLEELRIKNELFKLESKWSGKVVRKGSTEDLRRRVDRMLYKHLKAKLENLKTDDLFNLTQELFKNDEPGSISPKASPQTLSEM